MTLIEKFMDKISPEPTTGCWLWSGSHTGKSPREYGQFHDKIGKTNRAHRASWRLHRGDIPDGLCVLHKCDTPFCVNPAHLFLGTHLDNGRDMVSKGRSHKPKGESNHRSKLTHDQVVEIKKRSINEGQRKLAREFGVTHGCIYQLIRGLTW